MESLSEVTFFVATHHVLVLWSPPRSVCFLTHWWRKTLIWAAYWVSDPDHRKCVLLVILLTLPPPTCTFHVGLTLLFMQAWTCRPTKTRRATRRCSRWRSAVRTGSVHFALLLGNTGPWRPTAACSAPPPPSKTLLASDVSCETLWPHLLQFVHPPSSQQQSVSSSIWCWFW